MRVKTWLVGCFGCFCVSAMAASSSTVLLQCPKPEKVHVQYLKDKHGHLSCEYSSHLLGSRVTLRHMEQSVQSRCRPIYDNLSSVMVVRDGDKTRMISCGYGSNNKQGDTWAMANVGQQSVHLPVGCHLMGVKAHHEKYVQSHCDQSPLSCVIVCQNKQLS